MAESILKRVCRGAGSTEEGNNVETVFEALFAWAALRGLQIHADNGDDIAATVYKLADEVSPFEE